MAILVTPIIFFVGVALGIGVFAQAEQKFKEYQEKLASTDQSDACALYKLSAWCAENSLPIQRILLLRRVIVACPEHEKARRELGFIRYKGKWITEEELNLSKGLILIDGEWLFKNDAKERLQQKEVDKRNEKTQLIQQLGDPDPVKHKGAHDALRGTATEADVKLIAKHLQDRDPAVRRNAVILLGRLGFPSAREPILKVAFSDADAEARRSGILMLGKLGDLSVVSTLLRALEDQDPYFRRNAEEALEILLLHQFDFKYGAPVEERNKEIAGIRDCWQQNKARKRGELAMGALKNDSPYVREEAANVLAREPGEASVKALKELLADKEAKVREAGAKALGQFTGVAAVDALTTALKDETYFVQQAALRSLDALLGQDKPADLCKLVRESFACFGHAYAQGDALVILGKYRDAAACDVFRKIISENTCYPVVNPAIQGIVKIKDVEALELLQTKQAVNEVLEARNEVVVAYAELGGKLAVDAIIPFLKDKAYTVRRTAAGQLGRFSGLKAAPALLEAMEDPECPELRRIAWESLKKLSNMDMNFRFSADPEDRKKDLVPWLAWWERAKTRTAD